MIPRINNFSRALLVSYLLIQTRCPLPCLLCQWGHMNSSSLADQGDLWCSTKHAALKHMPLVTSIMSHDLYVTWPPCHMTSIISHDLHTSPIVPCSYQSLPLTTLYIPMSPFSPGKPFLPFKPSVPGGPVGPGNPFRPLTPSGPCTPGGPIFPSLPSDPGGPAKGVMKPNPSILVI